MLRFSAVTLLSAALVLVLSGCGDEEGVTTPTTTVPSPPDIAGRYYATWTLQVLRTSDGFQKQFRCSGGVTLQQTETGRSNAVLTGWASVSWPCPAEFYDLTGLVSANGAVQFATNGPAPLEGPCPGGQDVSFSGQSTLTGTGRHEISVRGVTNVTCPQYGEHQYTYIIEAWRY